MGKTTDFFPLPKELNPSIYAYTDTNPQYAGLLKVGYTTIDVPKRVAEQYPTKRPGEPPYKIVLEERALRFDGSSFDDHAVHKVLRKRGIENPDGEWFRLRQVAPRGVLRLISGLFRQRP